MKTEDIAFHEVFVDNEYVVHEAVVRNDFAWIGLIIDERWRSIKVQFDTLDHKARVWIDDSRQAYPPGHVIVYDKGYSKSHIREMSMSQVLDWLFYCAD
jgi:hypothetical protein